MRRVAMSLSLVLVVSACGGTEAEPSTTTSAAAEPATTTTVAATTSTAEATTTTIDPALEPILGTWFRWIPIAQGVGLPPIHGHSMLEFIETGMVRIGHRPDSEPLQDPVPWEPVTFDGEILETRLNPFPSDAPDECRVEGVYRLIWLSEDRFRLEVVDDDCFPRVQAISLFTGADDRTYDLTWRWRTQEVRDELAARNEALRDGGDFRYHPHYEGPRLPAYNGG